VDNARAIGEPGPLELVARATSALSTGSIISTARMAGASGEAHSQVCGTMDAQLPADT
jgi:oxalyl-CoA decarboxylase